MTQSLSGRFVLLCLAGFFGIIIAVNVLFIVFSVKSFSGEDEPQPFLQGIAYNKTLARHQAQADRGWRGHISAARLDNGHVRVTVSIADAGGLPLSPPAMTGELRHPTDGDRDRALKFRQTKPGHFEVDLKDVGRGNWDVVAHSSAPQVSFDAERRLWVP